MIQEILHVISNVPVITNIQPHTDAFTRGYQKVRRLTL